MGWFPGAKSIAMNMHRSFWTHLALSVTHKMVNQQEYSKCTHCRNSCFSWFAAMVTKENTMGKFLWFCFENNPRFHTQAAAAAKLLQLCPTLCDPIDRSPPGSSVLGILHARTPEWVAISFSNVWKWKVEMKSLSRVWPLTTPWTTAYQAPPSMGVSRQEYWSGVPLPHTRGTQKNCSGSSEMNQGGVQCAEWALGGIGELSAEIVKKGGQSESRIELERTGNLTGNHWDQLQGDSSKVKVKQLLWREHVYSKKKMSLEIKTGLFLEPSSGHFVVENSNAKLIILWAWISNF